MSLKFNIDTWNSSNFQEMKSLVFRMLKIVEYAKSPPIFRYFSIIYLEKKIFEHLKKEPIDWDLDDLDQLDVREKFRMWIGYIQKHQNQASNMLPEHCIFS